MITVLLSDVLQETEPIECSVLPLYVIRDGETIFYVGKSERDSADRVRQHCGLGTFPTMDALGSLIADNHPASGTWNVDFISLDDCGELLGNRPTSVSVAEYALIGHLRPALNEIGNPHGKDLPQKYTWKSFERQKRTIRRVLEG